MDQSGVVIVVTMVNEINFEVHFSNSTGYNPLTAVKVKTQESDPFFKYNMRPCVHMMVGMYSVRLEVFIRK